MVGFCPGSQMKRKPSSMHLFPNDKTLGELSKTIASTVPLIAVATSALLLAVSVPLAFRSTTDPSISLMDFLSFLSNMSLLTMSMHDPLSMIHFRPFGFVTEATVPFAASLRCSRHSSCTAQSCCRGRPQPQPCPAVGVQGSLQPLSLIHI